MRPFPGELGDEGVLHAERLGEVAHEGAEEGLSRLGLDGLHEDPK